MPDLLGAETRERIVVLMIRHVRALRRERHGQYAKKARSAAASTSPASSSPDQLQSPQSTDESEGVLNDIAAIDFLRDDGCGAI